MRIGILGFGEIGKAIAKFYDNPLIKDLDRDDELTDLDVLHVCIPYNKDFIKIVRKQIKESTAKLTIIHSTVQVGTTEKIGGMTVHSPCRGVHPNLYEGIKIHLKFVGADNLIAGELAIEHLEELGIKTRFVLGSKNTEALKLWETTQSFAGIVLQREIKEWCDKRGLDFNIVYTENNNAFNEGYAKLGYTQEFLPVFRNMTGKIGGHCLVPNAKILNTKLTKQLLKKNKKYGKMR